MSTHNSVAILTQPESAAPDESVIAQLANQLFQSGFPAVPSAPASAPVTAAATPVPAQAASDWHTPSTVELQSIPASLGRVLTLVPPPRGGDLPSTAAIQPAVAGAPVAANLLSSQTAPRSAGSAPIAVPGWPGSVAPVPFAIPASGSDSVTNQADLAENGGYGFLAEKPAASVRTQSAPAPLDQTAFFSPQLVPDLSAGKRQPFDARSVRRDFPILQEKVNGRPLIWLDNGATTQKPQAVIDRLAYFYEHENSNIHRAAHTLAARATDAYEAARDKVRRFIGASSSSEVIFVRGATEGINLVAKSWGAQNIGQDDEIVISWLEHHANIVPWQQLCAETGAKLRVIPVDDSGQILLGEYERLLNERTKIVAVTLVSNALGTVTPVHEIVGIAKRRGITTLVDGAQGVSHMKVDVQAIGCDFFIFSGHKMFGPTGIGVVYGRSEVLEATRPWQGGGNMIADVTFEKTVYQPAPNKFEAGTGNIADAVGLGAAIDYLDRFGMETINRYEHELLGYATEGLLTIPGLRLIGTAKEKAGVLSFVLEGFKTEEVGRLLDKEGIAVRSGHHCAQPILRRFGVEGTVRPSLALYNTFDDIDALVAAVKRIQAGKR